MAGTDPDPASPVSAGEFERAMTAIGGFEPAPAVAVGVSGGGDSMALLLLLRHWAASCGGSLLALTVDHGLRAESGREAMMVGAAVRRLAVPHRILRWEGSKPSAGLQAEARAARHRLLAGACAEAGILHLALAHNRDDQAETVLLRLSRGSGIDGLAGMAPVRAEGLVRVMRPLLGFPHDRLLATCRAHGASWVEDPSNGDRRFARARLRAARELLGAEGLDAERLCGVARRAGRARSALEQATADLLASAATLHPEGWITIDPSALLAAPEEIALRGLARCLVVVGGGARPVRDDAVERLLAGLAAGQAGTLAGCVVRPRRGAFMIAREPAAAAERLHLAPGARELWDGRFDVRVSPLRPGPVTVAALGSAGWREWGVERRQFAGRDLPAAVRETLPSLWSGTELLGVPAILPMSGSNPDGQVPADSAMLAPPFPLGRQAFTVVSDRDGII